MTIKAMREGFTVKRKSIFGETACGTEFPNHFMASHFSNIKRHAVHLLASLDDREKRT